MATFFYLGRANLKPPVQLSDPPEVVTSRSSSYQMLQLALNDVSVELDSVRNQLNKSQEARVALRRKIAELKSEQAVRSSLYRNALH